VLESSGYSVVTAGTGEDGLRAAVDARPAVIVVDGVLPGIDGSTVINESGPMPSFGALPAFC